MLGAGKRKVSHNLVPPHLSWSLPQTQWESKFTMKCMVFHTHWCWFLSATLHAVCVWNPWCVWWDLALAPCQQLQTPMERGGSTAVSALSVLCSLMGKCTPGKQQHQCSSVCMSMAGTSMAPSQNMENWSVLGKLAQRGLTCSLVSSFLGLMVV